MTSINKTANFCCKAYVKFAGDGGGEARAERRFCKVCGEYTYVESGDWHPRCRKCGERI